MKILSDMDLFNRKLGDLEQKLSSNAEFYAQTSHKVSPGEVLNNTHDISIDKPMSTRPPHVSPQDSSTDMLSDFIFSSLLDNL